MFALWNETDQVFASHDLFETVAEAETYAEKFRARFAGQGYYLTKDWHRIDPADVELHVVPADD
ncbi:MAG: hypothetical protein KGM24_15395 [Elusimicrobia bacterium]|nr:hypothetical protein [Elusimicrobiota bacterium]